MILSFDSYRRLDEMSDVEKTIGNNAGRIWEVLQEEGPQVRSKIIDMTNMPEEDFFGAIGWLARENKIRKDKRTYKVGKTNLTNKIGSDARKVCDILHKRNDLDISGIARLSKVKKRDCYSAIGWLAREGKVTAKIAVRKK